MPKSFVVNDITFEVEAVHFLDERPFIERCLRVRPYGLYIVFRLWDQKAQESIEISLTGWAPSDDDIVKAIQKYLTENETSRGYRARVNELKRYGPAPIFLPMCVP